MITILIAVMIAIILCVIVGFILVYKIMKNVYIKHYGDYEDEYIS